MSDVRRPRQPAFDPFGEPMGPWDSGSLDSTGRDSEARDSGEPAPRAAARAGHRGYGETRRAAIVFWALVLLFVAGRIYVADGPSAGTFAADVPRATEPQGTETQVAALR